MINTCTKAPPAFFNPFLLKAPFPAFGGKSRVAAEVWERFGDVRNYVEPFCFSAAVLLKRPGGAGAVETINDRNAFVSNFWRAVAADPDGVAAHADWPVNEVDLHARHRWLVGSAEAQAQLQRVREEPGYYDVRIAGWWCWGACCWIGSGWCDETRGDVRRETRDVSEEGDDLGGGQGVNRELGLPAAQVPHLGGANDGGREAVDASTAADDLAVGVRCAPSPTPPHIKLPHLDAAARGVAGGPSAQLPHLGSLADASGSDRAGGPPAPPISSPSSAGGDVPRDRPPVLAQAGHGVTAGVSGNMTNEESLRMEWGADGRGRGAARTGTGTGDKRVKLTGSGPRTGVHALGDVPHEGRPAITDEFTRGRGVNGHDAASLCDDRRAWVTAWMRRLADRLRPVRVCCGHWSRICDSPSTMTRLGTTGVFLDPPYRKHLADGKENRTAHIYASDRIQDIGALCDEVEAWCLKWGAEKDVRIALCGLEGEYPAIVAAGWEEFAWKSNGGYGNQWSGKKNENAERERVWFSPHCLKPGAGKEVGLFG